MATIPSVHDLLTRQGFERLHGELDALRRRRDVLLAEGDERPVVERRLRELELALSRAAVAEPPDDGTIGLGHRVQVRFADEARTAEYDLVGTVEAEPAQRRISVASPVGQALLGRRAGDHVDVPTPAGTRSLLVVAVSACA